MKTARKGWFVIPGVQAGDRTLDEQLKGLERALAAVGGKSVLDLGSAEGLISLECAKRGAAEVWGAEFIAEAVAEAKRQAFLAGGHGSRCRFVQMDLNKWTEAADVRGATPRHMGVVLALGVLHKLKRPEIVTRYIGKVARELAVLRLPPETAPVIVDPRSGNRPIDCEEILEAEGLELVEVARGHFDEWVGYFTPKAGRLGAG